MGSLQNWSILRGQISNYDKSRPLHKIFEEKCRNASLSEGIALIYKENATTYESLEEKANKLSRKIAHLCRQTGPNVDGDYVIAVRMHPTDDLLATLLAVWKTGAAYLPVHVTAPANRVRHLLSEAKPLLLITDREVSAEETVSNVKTTTYRDLAKSVENVPAAPLSTYEILVNSNGNSVAIILYTSGSTGTPKGVRIPHYVVLNRLNWQWRRFPYGETEEVCVFKTALTFVDSVSEIWAPLLHESAKTVLIVPSDVTKNPEQLVNVLENYEVERLVLVPSLLQAILMYLNMHSRRGGAKLLSKLTLWVCSGESLPKCLVTQLLSYYQDDKHRLCNFYGSTEIMGDVSFHEIKSQSQLKSFGENVPIGEPVYNTILYLLGENLEPVPNGEVGELYVAGHNVAAGYVAARNTDKFVQNHLTTDPGK